MKLNFLKEIFEASSFSVGLDLGNFSVKIAQIKKMGVSKDAFLSFAVVAIEGDKSRDKIIEAVKQAYQEAGTDSKKVNISISGPNITMRYVILHIMRETDLIKSFDFELEKYIPYKKEEVFTDYRMLAKLPNNKMVVLIVAAEKQFIQERIKLIRDIGLEPQLINIDALALIEAFKLFMPYAGGVIAILDIGYKITKLVVLEGNIPYFSRDIETGEFDIIQIISDGMDINFNEAKELAYNPYDKTEKIKEAIKLTLNSLLNEISLCFEYCERNLEKRAEQLFLSGGGAKLEILTEFLKKGLNLKTGLLDLAQRFKVASSLDPQRLKDCAPVLSVAIGLALS